MVRCSSPQATELDIWEPGGHGWGDTSLKCRSKAARDSGNHDIFHLKRVGTSCVADSRSHGDFAGSEESTLSLSTLTQRSGLLPLNCVSLGNELTVLCIKRKP